MAARWVTCLAAAMAGCAVGDIDLTGRSCPCVAGYQCDESTNRCVLETDASSLGDATSGDAGSDTDQQAPGDGPVTSGDSGGCSTGYASCAGGPSGGCGTYVLGDPQNCGGCGHVCGDVNVTSAPTCGAGKCNLSCNSGYANCDGNDANGCEAKLATDGTNCGACGVNCNGSACMAGLCAPVTLTTASGTIADLAIDSVNTYFTTASGVYSCDKSGCAQPTTLATTSSNTAITTDGATVYWAASDAIHACSVSGGASRVVFADPTATTLAVDGTSLYWTDENAGTVVKCGKASCPSTTTIASNQTDPIGIVVDGANVYWSTVGGYVSYCPLAGCGSAPLTLATGGGFYGELQANDSTLFWAVGCVYDPTCPGISMCPKAGCNESPTALGLYPTVVEALAVDATSLWWTDSQGAVAFCPVPGCSPRTTVATIASPDVASAIVIDSTRAYWAAGSTVYAMVRGP